MRGDKPNLIIFLPDQQRTDTIACYPGGAKVHSPNLAKLASQSVIFERAYVAQPVCTPSRSTLMTGLWPHQNGCVRNNIVLREEAQSVVELLGDSDYHAAYMGKWHLGRENEAQHGFRTWISTEGQSDYATYLAEHGHRPDKDGSFSVEFVARLSAEHSKPAFLERHACDFIGKHAREPFILVVGFVEPHSPYFGPLNDEHPINELSLDNNDVAAATRELPLRYRVMQEWQREQAERDRKKFDVQLYFGATPEEYRGIKQRYLGLVTLVDRSIGKILHKLDDLELAGNTIVMHTSDHGDMLGSHGLFGKEVMFDEATRVPWLVRLPGQQTSRRVQQPVSHIDFVPTILDLLGKKSETALSGSTLAPLVRGEIMEARPAFIEWSPNRMKLAKRLKVAKRAQAEAAMMESTRTVLRGEWKLNLRDRDLSELYNLAQDPHETVNQFNHPSSRDVVADLTKEVRDWQQRTGDILELPA